MSRFNLTAAGLAAGLLVAGPAPAQAPAPTDSAAKGAMEKSMSDADKAAWTKCKGMTHDAMLKDANCTRIAKEHPKAGKWANDQRTKPTEKK